MRRIVEPEWLDELPPANPQAQKSRGDLRRVNAIMGHAALIAKCFPIKPQPLRVVELGAGDGSLLLTVAQILSRKYVKVEVTLVDRQNLVSEETCQQFRELGWTVKIAVSDVFDWLAKTSHPVHLTICNLFLHHFPPTLLQKLLEQIAHRTESFIACEPRRSLFALTTSRFVWAIGCNAVTRHDAHISVRAGFTGRDLSALWPCDKTWLLEEQSFRLLSHYFMARKIVP